MKFLYQKEIRHWFQNVVIIRNQGLLLWGRACSTEIQWHWVLAQLPGALQGPILLDNVHGEGTVLLWTASMGTLFPTLRLGLDPFHLRIFCDLWLSQHITPHSCCVQRCLWDKSSSRSSLYHSLHLILCFSICHVQGSQKVASAHAGWWRLREPRGLHSHASSVTKPGPQGGDPELEEPKGTRRDFHTLDGHRRLQPARTTPSV